MLKITLANQLKLEVSALEKGIFHIQTVGMDGPQESLLDRYGIIQPPAVDTTAQYTASSVTGADATLAFAADGTWQLVKNSQVIAAALPATVPASAPTVYRNAGYKLEMQLHQGEKLVGFGDQVRTQLILNGLHDEMYLKYPIKHAPVPFYMSSRGYGIFFNTTRRLVYQVPADGNGAAQFAVENEFMNIYLITGNNYDEMVDRFTRLSGRPVLPPMKSFGLWLLFQTWTSGNELLMLARMLRELQIPCDNLSLEPGWMEKYYDASENKEWCARGFRACGVEAGYRGGAEGAIQALGRMGFNLGLWLCSRWDYTYEEERRLPEERRKTRKESILNLAGIELQHDDTNVGHQPMYLDEYTNRERPWFEHLKKFVNDGARFFKLDPAWLINEFPDRLYGNGKTDEEMHNLAFLLASRQMKNDYEAFTGKRYYGISVAGWTGLQQIPGTWAGDTGGGKQSMAGLLQDAVVGHYCTTCDMNVEEIGGIHMGFLLPWAMINGWASFTYPGFMGNKLDQAIRSYSELRMRLLLYYYALAERACRTGKAILRPLFMVYPNEEWTYHVTNLFMIGDFILTDVYADEKIRLPDGKWYDYWTGRIYEGNGTVQSIPVPENRGGHLLIKEGALIPLLPVRQHVDPATITEIEWLVFPNLQSDTFDLYMDDGDSLQHRDGAFARQTVRRNGQDLAFGEIEGAQPEFLRRIHHTITIVPAHAE